MIWPPHNYEQTSLKAQRCSLNGFYCSRKRLARDPGAHLSAQLQRLELVLDQRHRTLILAWGLDRWFPSNQCPANTLLRHLSPAQSVGKALQSQVIYTWLWRAFSLLRMKIYVFNSVRTFKSCKYLQQHRLHSLSFELEAFCCSTEKNNVLITSSLPRRRFLGSSFFIPPPVVNWQQ